MNFDPYSDRLSRDIRNSLSSALVQALTEDVDDCLSAVVNEWLAKAPAPVYQTFIKDRLTLYRQALGEIRAHRLSDPRYQAICLWNLGLFFEMHELLEPLWQKTREPERSALKGWIQAAGAYVHYQCGNVDAAQRLAQRAAVHLRKGRLSLGFIANLDQFIEAVGDPANGAPQMVPDQSH